MLGRAGSLTPPALRAAISRAVMEVNPEKAKKRREHMARRTRVERWAEDSGNAGLAGRELPPAEVLAADQRVTGWARQLRQAGLDGDMDQLRARAFMDLLLGTDSRPLASSPDGRGGEASGTRGCGDPQDCGPGPSDPPGPRVPAPAGPVSGVIPPGFAGRVTLTIPAATLLGLADRPGEMAGLGPIDPDLARDLAGAAARSPRSTWCVTVTDSLGHAIGHGCARPAPASTVKRDKHGTPGGPGPPGRPSFTLTPADQPGPAGGYGTGDSPPGSPDSGTCSCRSGRSPPANVITGTRPRAMIPGSCCGTWPRSGTPRAPGRGAAGRRNGPISSTTFRTRLVAGRVCATGTRSAAMITG